MPLVNSILSWQCPPLSLAMLLCGNYLLITNINKSNWAGKISQVALAILLVDYLHRITVIHIRVFRFLKLSNIGVSHGPQCYDEENCRDFLGDLPNALVSGIVTMKAGVVKVVPEKYTVHAIVLVISVVGLLIEVYISFINLLVFGVNFILIIAGLHRAELLNYFLAPFIKLWNMASEYHGHVARAVTSLEESFVNELNEGVPAEEANAQTRHCILTAAMTEMCAGVPIGCENEAPSVQLAPSSERAPQRHRVTHAGDVETDSDVDNDDLISRPAIHDRMFAEDSDGDSLILNESRIPSPTRSWSSTEELVPSNKALLFSENDSDVASDEDDDDEDLSLSQIGARERSRRGTLANNVDTSGNSNLLLNSGETSLISNTLSAGFQAITNLAFKAFDSGIVVDANSKRGNPQTTQNNEEFVFVDSNRDHDDSIGDVYESDTLPTSLQIDSQGPYTFVYETRSRTKKSGGKS